MIAPTPTVSHPPAPQWVLVETRYDDYRAGYDAPYWVGWDIATGKTLWRTYGTTEGSCVAAIEAEYPGAILVAVSAPVEKGERL